MTGLSNEIAVLSILEEVSFISGNLLHDAVAVLNLVALNFKHSIQLLGGQVGNRTSNEVIRWQVQDRLDVVIRSFPAVTLSMNFWNLSGLPFLTFFVHVNTGLGTTLQTDTDFHERALAKFRLKGLVGEQEGRLGS